MVATVWVVMAGQGAAGNSGFLWDWMLSLRTDNQGNVVSTVDILNDPLGFGVPALSPIIIANGRASMTIGSFSAHASLGQLIFHDKASVLYEMGARVRGPGFNEGGLARLGDPYDVNGNYGSAITFAAAPTVAPEPATSWLVATGLIVGGAAGRRRRNSLARLRHVRPDRISPLARAV